MAASIYFVLMVTLALPVLSFKCYDCGFPNEACTRPFEPKKHELVECGTKCVTKYLNNDISKSCYDKDIFCNDNPKNCTFCTTEVCNGGNDVFPVWPLLILPTLMSLFYF